MREGYNSQTQPHAGILVIHSRVDDGTVREDVRAGAVLLHPLQNLDCGFPPYKQRRTKHGRCCQHGHHRRHHSGIDRSNLLATAALAAQIVREAIRLKRVTVRNTDRFAQGSRGGLEHYYRGGDRDVIDLWYARKNETKITPR